MTRAEWLELAKRCEEAKKGDADIARDFAIALGWTFQKMKRDSRPYWRKTDKAQWFEKSVPPTFTASLDAIVALIERELPGWAWKVGTCSVSDDAWVCPDWNGPHATALEARFGFPRHGHWTDVGFDIDKRPPGNPALALCAAFCRAKAEMADE